MNKHRKDFEKEQHIEASRLLLEGVSKSEVARRIGVTYKTINTWVKDGKVGNHVIPLPKKGKGKAQEPTSIPLPPLKFSEKDVSQAVAEMKGHDGSFSRNATEKYESLWVKLNAGLEHIVEHTDVTQLDPKGLKDWVDVLQKLQAAIELYYANAKPDLTEEEKTSMQELQARRAAMAQLYNKTGTEE